MSSQTATPHYEKNKAYRHAWDNGYRKCDDKISPDGLETLEIPASYKAFNGYCDA